jgi:hypothetical protein
MLPSHHQRYEGVSDQELDLQRRGSARHLTVEQRARIADSLEDLGFEVAPRRLRHLNDCLTRRARIQAVPDDGRRRLKSGTDRPLLRAVELGADAPAVDPDRAWWEDVRRMTSRHADREVRPTSRFALQAMQRAAATHLS